MAVIKRRTVKLMSTKAKIAANKRSAAFKVLVTTRIRAMVLTEASLMQFPVFSLEDMVSRKIGCGKRHAIIYYSWYTGSITVFRSSVFKFILMLNTPRVCPAFSFTVLKLIRDMPE